MKTLVLGSSGEVGRALTQVLREASRHGMDRPDDIVSTWDPKLLNMPAAPGPYDVMNVCFPYFKGFEDEVCNYANVHKPTLVIIHSTVPVGTTRKINDRLSCDVVHSPVHGQHPHLIEGLRTFVKYVGSCDNGDHGASKFLEWGGMTPFVVANAETSELSKLMCTTQTAVGILVEKGIHALCQQVGANFEEVYTLWNHLYNDGYGRLKKGPPEVAYITDGIDQRISVQARPDYTRPVYNHIDGPIGGHCLLPNAKLVDCWMNDLIRQFGDCDEIKSVAWENARLREENETLRAKLDGPPTVCEGLDVPPNTSGKWTHDWRMDDKPICCRAYDAHGVEIKHACHRLNVHTGEYEYNLKTPDGKLVIEAGGFVLMSGKAAAPITFGPYHARAGKEERS